VTYDHDEVDKKETHRACKGAGQFPMNMLHLILLIHIPRLQGLQESLLAVLNAQVTHSEVNVHIRPRDGNLFWRKLLVRYVISFAQSCCYICSSSNFPMDLRRLGKHVHHQYNLFNLFNPVQVV
jgi:hypothetical protein